ncbi:DNA cytosine methyltransferase [Thermomonas paludicola]|uniref:DNA cytosine methyltransferase n=1 Tax=Thermomonas paludicola TaxID=2884874 RepID=UPI0021152CE0|nr:DNA cytosine methyltransferase [Thermomonas paludicola]
MENSAVPARPTFIDLFSGCGGLSLGLSQAGWQGLFAIERATDAFETFRANFLGEASRCRFQWPAWLEQSAHSIDDVLKAHHGELAKLRNKVDLIAGGPPCQGFSFAGKRNNSDPRNKMFQRYVSFVELINPKFLVLENVPGMNVAHTKRGNKTARAGQTYYDKLHDALGELGYTVGPMILDTANFGVPQRRARLVVIGIRSDMVKKFPSGCTGLFDAIDVEGGKQLSELGNGTPVTAQQAISDLVVGTGKQVAQRTIEYTGFGARRGYVQLKYEGPHDTAYQRLMSAGVAPDQMDSMRLARHGEDVRARFKKILATSLATNRRGVNLSSDDREIFGMLKHRTVPMSPTQPAPTLTTLPDDILHYSDPRILTVRESARLQSFPDWFTFHGKYTTGGDRRKVECPRYTQVGNAVPPLLAMAIGAGILTAWKSIDAKAKGSIGKKTVIKKHIAMTMS